MTNTEALRVADRWETATKLEVELAYMALTRHTLPVMLLTNDEDEQRDYLRLAVNGPDQP